MALASDTEDPLLAWWNVGAGKAVAWTSDAEGAWTNGFLRWEDAPRFFGAMLAKALPARIATARWKAGVNGETLNVRYTLEEAEGGRAEAEVVLPDGTRQALSLAETAPGQFDGQMDAPSEGAYAIRVTYTQEDGTAHTQEGGAVRGFSQEYDLMQAEGKSLTKLAEQTGGRMLAGTADFWQTPVERATSRQSLRELLCVLTLIWLLMDIALRKLPWEELLGHARPQGQQTQPRRGTKGRQAAQGAHGGKASPRSGGAGHNGRAAQGEAGAQGTVTALALKGWNSLRKRGIRMARAAEGKNRIEQANGGNKRRTRLFRHLA